MLFEWRQRRKGSTGGVAERISLPAVGKPGKQDLKHGKKSPSLAPGPPDVPPTSGCGTEMWDDNKERREGDGISTPSFLAVERKQREGRQDEKGGKQLEKALARQKPTLG